MSLYCDTSIEIEKTDNGYILTWCDEAYKKHSTVFDHGGLEPKTRGREIFKTKKQALDRASEIL